MPGTGLGVGMGTSGVPADRQPAGASQAGMTRNRGWPNSTGWPFLTRISVIVPETPAGMSVKTFMASMTQTVVSGRTAEPTETNGGASGALEA